MPVSHDDHYDGAGDDDSKDWGIKMMIVHIMEVMTLIMVMMITMMVLMMIVRIRGWR